MPHSGAAPRAPTFKAVPIPAPILRYQGNDTFCIGFFFDQEITFLHAISRGYGFRTVAPVADQNWKTILKEITSVINLYQNLGFQICNVHADKGCQCIRDALRPIEMNIVPSDSHVGKVERSMRTIKELL